MSDNRMILVASYFDVREIKYPTQYRVIVCSADTDFQNDKTLSWLFRETKPYIYLVDAVNAADALQAAHLTEYGVRSMDFGNWKPQVDNNLEGI